MTGDTCRAWNPTSCTGGTDCPPRCPRFVDARGEVLLVEPLADGHLEQLCSMYGSYPAEHRSMGLPPVTSGYVAEWLADLRERGRNLVARDGDRVVGHAAYSPTSSDEPHLIVFVDPGFFERGIGSELVRQAIAYADADGHEALVLDVTATNERAVAVYRTLGFEEIERRGNDVRMRLSLEEPIADAVGLAPADRPANA
ncbi:GNAT family N-acetyltransferase [Natrialbaceae archaeon AArc-T1-2]|uniref:GNAT family N-acetyltransferase n=1 Tax=Natrialbaceae archaeon AArc-T1-2 TaxID=3053904 RepID=UPI00255B1E25|nr:GNAT family N-acetyltransferase [Natrialbaceae archaeon AArc-T1-2]WIV66973.1 GNAT family N-acetyltransferase [Natrialbaceae archaeon AArc-T1-2]